MVFKFGTGTPISEDVHLEAKFLNFGLFLKRRSRRYSNSICIIYILYILYIVFVGSGKMNIFLYV